MGVPGLVATGVHALIKQQEQPHGRWQRQQLFSQEAKEVAHITGA